MVGFVEHEDLGRVQLHASARHMIEKAARRGDQHLQAARQHVDLRALRDAADDDADAESRTHELSVSAKALGYLRGEFAGRREHQHARRAGSGTAAIGEKAGEDRQSERRRLAGARLGDAEKVASFKERRDGLGLYRGGRFVSFAIHGAKQRLGETEIEKFRQWTSFV